MKGFILTSLFIVITILSVKGQGTVILDELGNSSPLSNYNGNIGISNSNPKNKLEISNAFSFHSGGNKVIGLGYSVSSGAMLDGYMGELRWDPSVGTFRIMTSASTSLAGQIATMYDRILIDKNGKIGIGTSSLSIANTSINDLVIGNASASKGLVINANSNNDGILAFASDGSMVSRFIYNNPTGTLNYYKYGTGNLFTILGNGNVGIGTATDPLTKLHIKNGSLINWTPSFGTIAIFESTQSNRAFVNISATNESELWFGNGDTQNLGRIRYENNNNVMEFWVGTLERMKIDNAGNVGIGTNTPSTKLDVAGTIKAQEIEVTLASMEDLQLNGTLAANTITYITNGQTADYVFEKDYNLKDLSEVEAFITTNKHLPDIPSASEMEEQGVNLAEMNKLLLQKVEELTLYIIEKNKRIKVIENESDIQKYEIKLLKSELKEIRDLLIDINNK